jgi:hypothetical protein
MQLRSPPQPSLNRGKLQPVATALTGIEFHG